MKLEGTGSCVDRVDKGHLTTKEAWDSSGGDLVALKLTVMNWVLTVCQAQTGFWRKKG